MDYWKMSAGLLGLVGTVSVAALAWQGWLVALAFLVLGASGFAKE